MSAYTLEGLADFILQLYDKENETEIWETWLHKEKQLSYADYKKKYLKRMYKAKIKPLSKEDEQKIMENAARFIKPINKGGET